MRTLRLLMLGWVTLALVGCSSRPSKPATEVKDPLSLQQWQQIKDPEEKFSRHSIERLSRADAEKVLRYYRK